jgi:hypothetical protein
VFEFLTRITRRVLSNDAGASFVPSSVERFIMQSDITPSFVCGLTQKFGRCASVLLAPIFFGVAAHAGEPAGFLDCRSVQGAATVGARPGGTFVARISLESDVGIVYNSALFRVVLTRPGVAIEDYAWAAPFETGGPTDFSLVGLELPSVITKDSLAGPTYPTDVIDVEFGNFLLTGDATDGTVVDVTFTMPAKSQPGDTFFIAAVPDTFAFGFIPYPIAAGSVLTVRTTFSPDFDGDGSVGAADLSLYLAAWGTPNGDLNGDGLSNSADLALLLAAWGS